MDKLKQYTLLNIFGYEFLIIDSIIFNNQIQIKEEIDKDHP